MVHDISDGRQEDPGLRPPGTGDHLAREQAIKQIERRRRFWIRASVGTLVMIILVVIWALAEYHNAGGWPTKGFSQSSGSPDVWNWWIIYPAIAWVLLIAGGAWSVFRRKPISEAEIKHEMERQAGQH